MYLNWIITKQRLLLLEDKYPSLYEAGILYREEVNVIYESAKNFFFSFYISFWEVNVTAIVLTTWHKLIEFKPWNEKYSFCLWNTYVPKGSTHEMLSSIKTLRHLYVNTAEELLWRYVIGIMNEAVAYLSAFPLNRSPGTQFSLTASR